MITQEESQELSDVYQIESVEQLRALADELRQRIFHTLTVRPMTVTQVGEVLGVAPAKIHYHVRELERVGLVHLAKTREKGGILEKYYRPVARSVNVPASLMHSASPEEHVSAVADALNEVTRGFLQALDLAGAEGFRRRNTLALGRGIVWATDDELRDLMLQIENLLEPYADPDRRPDARERSMAWLAYAPSRGGDESEREVVLSQPETPVDQPSSPRVRRIVVAGAIDFDRDDLERYVRNNERLNITAFGVLSFAADVTPDLADQVVVALHYRGWLRASPQVKNLLERKSSTPR